MKILEVEFYSREANLVALTSAFEVHGL